MSKIIDWDKNGNQDWVRRIPNGIKINGFVSIDQGYFGNEWHTSIEDFLYKQNIKKNFPTKEDALNFAIDWMKAHPNK